MHEHWNIGHSKGSKIVMGPTIMSSWRPNDVAYHTPHPHQKLKTCESSAVRDGDRRERSLHSSGPCLRRRPSVRASDIVFFAGWTFGSAEALRRAVASPGLSGTRCYFLERREGATAPCYTVRAGVRQVFARAGARRRSGGSGSWHESWSRPLARRPAVACAVGLG
jgi:hypothetical protein